MGMGEADTLGPGRSSVLVRLSAVALNSHETAPGEGGRGAGPGYSGLQAAVVAPTGPCSCLLSRFPSSVCLCCRAQLLHTQACFPLELWSCPVDRKSVV